MELSNRLQAVADMLSENKIVADLGTDHGYIPIHLILSGKCQKVYAMDINEGPYNKAKQHIAGHGLSEKIVTRLSDGMSALDNGEANSIIIAGMGGGLVIKILEQDKRLWESIDEFILQPQSEIHKVRQYLQEMGFKIVKENMILEDGKYYPMMKAIKGKDTKYKEFELYYGKYLIENKHPILMDFIQKEIGLKENIIGKLKFQIASITGKDTELNDTYRTKIDGLNERIVEIQKEVELAYEVQRSM